VSGGAGESSFAGWGEGGGDLAFLGRRIGRGIVKCVARADAREHFGENPGRIIKTHHFTGGLLGQVFDAGIEDNGVGLEDAVGNLDAAKSTRRAHEYGVKSGVGLPQLLQHRIGTRTFFAHAIGEDEDGATASRRGGAAQLLSGPMDGSIQRRTAAEVFLPHKCIEGGFNGGKIRTQGMSPARAMIEAQQRNAIAGPQSGESGMSSAGDSRDVGEHAARGVDHEHEVERKFVTGDLRGCERHIIFGDEEVFRGE